MNGRLEHTIKTENNIQKILDTLPIYVSEYYYSIISSSQPKTCEDYLKKIRKFLFFCFENLNKSNIEDISDSDIGKYFKSIQTKNINGEILPTSFAYQKSVWTALNGFFSYIYTKGYIKFNPMSLIKRPKNDDDVSYVSLSINDVNEIIKNIQNGTGSNYAKSRQKEWIERDVAIFKLFLCTGMRKTALSEINISDIDFNENTIKIIDKRHKIHMYYMEEKLKLSLLLWCNKRNKILNNIDEDALFISMRKCRMSEKAIYNLIGKYAEDTLGYKISPHKLRAVFCVTYYEASGGDIKSTMDAMGHRSVVTTQRYLKTKNNARKESSIILNELIV